MEDPVVFVTHPDDNNRNLKDKLTRYDMNSIPENLKSSDAIHFKYKAQLFPSVYKGQYFEIATYKNIFESIEVQRNVL